MVVDTVIELELGIVLGDVVVTEAGNTGCTTDVPDVRGTLVVEVMTDVSDVGVDVIAVAIVADDAPA